MKKINYVKFALDIIMALLFVLFFNKNVLGGLTFHEYAGLFFAVAYFTHVLLNLGWVKRVTVKMFDRSLPWKLRGSYALNLLLLISMSFIIVSGILVSHVVFPNMNVANQGWFKMTHISVSFLVLVLVGVHVGLHWQWVMQVWNKIWSVKGKIAWLRYTATAAAVLILLFGVYEINQTGFMSRLASSASVIGMGSQQPMMGEKGRLEGAGSGNVKPQRPAQGTANGAPARGGEGARFGGGSVNVWNVIVTYTGIMAVFVIVTYYVRKGLLRARKPSRAA
ncbi:DUF4405 domain-containing protein [Paenibacillus chartarius]|uniref:DUF4405 domain-containing protein n=1 Tax=Paenibacillus chartarius TaxID=747481 RepID=A0ABV6DFY5_9BACL